MGMYLSNSVGGDMESGAHQETFPESHVYFYYLMLLIEFDLEARLWGQWRLYAAEDQ